MNSILLLLSVLGLVALTSAFSAGTLAKLGEKTEIQVSSEKVKAITRKLDNGKNQTWNVEGPNKGTWVDEKGKKIDSKNYNFKAPGTIVIKKVTKDDAGVYDYTPLVALPPPPPGVHVDPGFTGIQLVIGPS